jgi:hypothetical protein
MSQASKTALPPNPYKLKPVKRLEDLAGRARERKAIRYYLNLTATGDSPHLALIGQRGVGKTSLLNGAETIARELHLLPVRLDMNELKAKSPGRFWHDLYQSLALSMVKAGCWGGEQGAIYAELLRMLHARQPGSLEKAVIQIPFVFSCHQGSIDSFECPDALVVSDFNCCLLELRSKGFSGFALLIDEADCIGKNVPLLQMFRNIFQTVEHCSLVLAGTEAVFPALSEVFSPIPRQFHRVDVKPFARWSDTMELVFRPIPKDLLEAITPEGGVLRELHELCGGAPDEIQLYCHHMYRSVEDGTSKRMNLSPQVFREVLRAYRSNSSSSNVDAVLNAIERLPDTLLFQSKWLSRRSLTLEENIRVSVLLRELRQNKPLSPEERAEIATQLTTGYRTLFQAGIIEIDNSIRLAGAPLSAGFWKSYVEVEKGKRWSWSDDSFAENMRQPITSAIGKACGAAALFETKNGDNAKRALANLRAGKPVKDVDDSMGEMIFAAVVAREPKATHAVDVVFQWEAPAGRQANQMRFLEKPNAEMRQDEIQKWLDAHKTMLAGNEISFVITGFERWELPSPEELHRLGNIAGYRIPDAFGPPLGEQAVAKFGSGDVNGCMDIFARMVADKDDPQIRNNMAFCQIVTGDVAGGLKNAAKAVAEDYEPLYELNKGVALCLQGDAEGAKQCLHNALNELHAHGDKYFTHADYLLVLAPDLKTAGAQPDLLVEVAVLINLWRIGDLPRSELEAALTRLVPQKTTVLLAALDSGQSA